MEQTKPKVTASDFFLQIGFIAAFYTFIITFITFLFSLVNTFFPDRQYNYYDPYGSQMRFSVSMLIVATPLFLYLLKRIYARIQAEPLRNELWVRRWGLYLTLFLAVLALAIDLVYLINTFLGGEITTRFTLKALIIIAATVKIWLFTRAELNNAIATRPKLRRYLGYATITTTIVAIVAGFFFIGSPSLLRDIRDDNQRENDLNNIQSQVLSYYQSKNATLPATLDLINVGNPYAMEIPKDPATQAAYQYRVLESKLVGKVKFPAFELCAVFAQDGDVDERVQGTGGGMSVSRPSGYDTSYYPYDAATDFSKHPAGNKCFEVSIDPQRYKPYDQSTYTSNVEKGLPSFPVPTQSPAVEPAD